MPIYRGTVYSRNFRFKDSDRVVIDITGMTFTAHIKDTRSDTTPLVTLTTADGGLIIADGPAGQMTMLITAAQTALLTPSKVVFDVLRTDVSPGPTYMFGGSVKVKTPVTDL